MFYVIYPVYEINETILNLLYVISQLYIYSYVLYISNVLNYNKWLHDQRLKVDLLYK